MEKERFPYLNRELSWIDFNARVLEEACKKENPLMERFRFLGISASNLDEFFMVRVAGVRAQVHSKCHHTDASGMTPSQLFPVLKDNIHDFMDRQYNCLHRSILPALHKENIRFLTPADMNPDQKRFIANYFNEVLFPVLTPLAVDTSRPFPLLANKSLNIAVRLKDEEGESCFAVVQVPAILSRFLELPVPQDGGHAFVLLEDIIIDQIEQLFELHEIKACTLFRLTRNSDIDIDEEAEDLLVEMVKSIKKRKRGRPVRVEILQKSDRETRHFLSDMLQIKEDEIYEVPGPIDLTLFSKFANFPDFSQYCFRPVVPVYPPADFVGYANPFDAIRSKDRLVHHPYESFQCVVDFVRAAAEDPNVLAIKQTLYRVSGNSPIVAALIKAAENGKQVTVLVELKARFDEENNINWAKKLEQAGCHVIYGLAGLKTHCKILLVVRREEDGIRRYVHMGTGNYNDSTAKIYTDVSLFTCKEPYGMDASSLFNVLTGYSRPPEYYKFVVAPHGMRHFFRHMIKQEIHNAEQGLPCGIMVKVNSLVDPKIIHLLYKASQAGVPVDLIVRGICCLNPGIPGVSDRITVHSIIGQLLEHSRIFRFENAGNPKVYMGSADWMPRNLDRRVELVFPIEEPDLKQRALEMLDLMLRDNVNTRVMQEDAKYVPISRRGKTALNVHQEFIRMAQQEADRLTDEDWSTGFHPCQNPDMDG